MASSAKSARSVTWCEKHQKLSYVSRKDARRIASRLPEHKTPYRCEFSDNLWHIGGLPARVKYGEMDRKEFYNR
jgi:hypothetical protein